MIDPLLLTCLLVATIPAGLIIGFGIDLLWNWKKGRHDNRR